MGDISQETMDEWRDDMRTEAYEEERYERLMRDSDSDLFQEEVDDLIVNVVFYDYKQKLRTLCDDYGIDFDGWWEYSMDSI